MKKFILMITVLASSVFALPALPAAAGLFDSAKEDACAGSQVTAAAPNCADEAAGETDTLIQSIINLLSIVVGIIAVIMIIINGLRFITSAGDANAVTAARNGVIYAVIGLVLVVLAQIIVRFVVGNAA